jgi:hypothetical protein
MGKVTFNAAQVALNPTYNWSALDPTIGMLDIGFVSTDAPGPGPAFAVTTGSTVAPPGIQDVNVSVLPRPVFQPQLGQIIRAWEPSLGFGEFIYLAIPSTIALPLGTLVTWYAAGGLASSGTLTGAGSMYDAIIVPVKATAQKTGMPVAVCVSSTVANSGAGITANATQAQYAWFQIGGNTQILKTAAQVAPVGTAQGAGVYISGTVGRVYFTSSSGGQILGARLGNAVTVTSTVSCILVYLNGRPALEGP